MRELPPDPERPEDVAAVEHSRHLVGLIRREAVARGGLLPFDRFMELALYAPGLGYYVSGTRKFGRGGDFVTAPDISPLFARCLARQCGEALRALGGGDVLELGAGTGALAADLLAALATEGVLPEHYLILEPSGELRERQRCLLERRLPHLSNRLIWLDRLPVGFEGVLIANEVADAMPVHRFVVRQDRSPGEVLVRPVEDRWEEVIADPVSAGLEEAVRRLQAQGLAMDEGYTSEVNLRLGPWIAALGDAIERGLALIIDYGYTRSEYYHAERRAGTLMCHYRHRAHTDPYRFIGLQDITAHVDFSALSRSATAAGWEIAGFTTQAHFLLGCGLDGFMAGVSDPKERLDLLLGVKQLVLPSAMGERFRVLGLSKSTGENWCGFSVRDLRGRL